MAAQSRLELHVQWETPIHGRVCEAGGRLDRPFSGWLGLIAALDAAHELVRAEQGDSESRCCDGTKGLEET
jgi:hypothetical protein